jgi:DNA invertase Pin-like site-specific DNA recombinase
MQPTKTLVAYYRVSTKDQGESGLGLEGQIHTVHTYATTTGAKILASYQEIESGRRSDRPMLGKAIAHANRSGATLVIAKLDRLARNVHFLSGLMEAGVDFTACDNPHASRLTIHVLAVLAEHEARMISERTKLALAAYRARGGVLGRPANFTAEGRLRGAINGAAQTKAKAKAAYADLVPSIRTWREAGESLRTIAKNLNAQGHTLRGGGPWTAVQISRVLKRY